MPRVVHFEIHAGDPDRAVNFYKTLFGWNFQKWEGPMEYWMVITGPDDQPGINGGLRATPGRNRWPGRDCLRVHSRRRRCRRFGADGARQTAAQVALPKMAIPGVGWLGLLQRHRRKYLRDDAERSERSVELSRRSHRLRRLSV